MSSFILRFASADEQKSFARELRVKGIEHDLGEFLPDIIVRLDDQDDGDLREWIKTEIPASARLLPDMKLRTMDAWDESTADSAGRRQ